MYLIKQVVAPVSKKISSKWKRITFFLIISILFVFLAWTGLRWFGTNLVGGGGAEQIVPDSVKAREVNKSISNAIYYLHEGWGPCAPDEICEQETVLYVDGTLIKTGEINSIRQISISDLNTIKIKLHEIINKDCAIEIIYDYWALAKINYEGTVKDVQFPGCSDITSAINNFLK